MCLFEGFSETKQVNNISTFYIIKCLQFWIEHWKILKIQRTIYRLSIWNLSFRCFVSVASDWILFIGIYWMNEWKESHPEHVVYLNLYVILHFVCRTNRCIIFSSCKAYRKKKYKEIIINKRATHRTRTM